MPNYIKYEYDADDEEPECIRCDNFGCQIDCSKYCGANYGWWGYRRTEAIEIDEEINEKK